MGPIQQFLEATSISQVIEKSKTKQIVVLEHNSTVDTALRTLAMHNILSAPLVMSLDLDDEVGDAANTPMQLLAWVDIVDILKSFLDNLKSKSPDIPVKMLALMTTLEKEGPIFAQRTLITIKSSDDSALMYGIERESSVLSAIKNLFVQRPTHRIALFDGHGNITHIISQMDICRYLLHHAGRLGPETTSKSIEELGLLTGKPPVFTVSPHEPTLMAYSKMSDAGVSGAPVVTETGEAIANLSVSDIRALTSEHFGALALPVAEFLALEHHTSYIGYSVKSSVHAHQPFFARGGGKESSGRTDIQVFACDRRATLLDVLRMFVDNHIHRVYIVQEKKSPLKVDAVLTMTDMLQYFAGVW